MGTFEAEVFRVDEPGGWYFVRVPQEHAPDEVGAWGRSPVVATVEGRTWATSVWRDRRRGWLLAIPKKVRGQIEVGDVVTVSVEADPTRPLV